MFYGKIYGIVDNKEQTDAIMDIIRPLQRTRAMALELLANICFCMQVKKEKANASK